MNFVRLLNDIMGCKNNGYVNRIRNHGITGVQISWFLIR